MDLVVLKTSSSVSVRIPQTVVAVLKYNRHLLFAACRGIKNLFTVTYKIMTGTDAHADFMPRILAEIRDQGRITNVKEDKDEGR